MLPEQATASQVQGALDRLNTLQQPLKDQSSSSDTVAQGKARDGTVLGRQQATVKILTFESELDPLQCNVLPSGHLVFFRAWRNNPALCTGIRGRAARLPATLHRCQCR